MAKLSEDFKQKQKQPAALPKLYAVHCVIHPSSMFGQAQYGIAI
jgi:hypothetical protein